MKKMTTASEIGAQRKRHRSRPRCERSRGFTSSPLDNRPCSFSRISQSYWCVISRNLHTQPMLLDKTMKKSS
ncbi:hypothetical protein HanIR_Chr02g0099641 [Helianthus annuus]|nr:hypothetical protein HanIR_Chr02g0099641 [Helianthus annuus]